jgi:hypothetical protein
MFYHIRRLTNYLKNVNIKIRQQFTVILVLLFITILLGERIPYLLIINFLFMITLQINQNKENYV